MLCRCGDCNFGWLATRQNFYQWSSSTIHSSGVEMRIRPCIHGIAMEVHYQDQQRLAVVEAFQGVAGMMIPATGLIASCQCHRVCGGLLHELYGSPENKPAILEAGERGRIFSGPFYFVWKFGKRRARRRTPNRRSTSEKHASKIVPRYLTYPFNCIPDITYGMSIWANILCLGVLGGSKNSPFDSVLFLSKPDRYLPCTNCG